MRAEFYYRVDVAQTLVQINTMISTIQSYQVMAVTAMKFWTICDVSSIIMLFFI
jgi:hypothetical protein